MKLIILSLMGSFLIGCSSIERSKCEDVCLAKNCKFLKVEKEGCVCQDKENPDERYYSGK